MARSVTVIGSTGLIGKQFLESVSEGEFKQVTAISRREIPELMGKSFINQTIHDFSDLEAMRPDLKTDILVCALGTTIKTAGSQEAFMRVDHDLPLEIARIAHEAGCQTFILISSVGADAQSSIFYSRVKGQVEAALDELGFNQFHILRPSMLLGERQESRPGEFVGKLILTPLSFLIPWKYKPIHANTVSDKIKRLASWTQPGKYIWEGKSLFHLN